MPNDNIKVHLLRFNLTIYCDLIYFYWGGLRFGVGHPLANSVFNVKFDGNVAYWTARSGATSLRVHRVMNVLATGTKCCGGGPNDDDDDADDDALMLMHANTDHGSRTRDCISGIMNPPYVFIDIYAEASMVGSDPFTHGVTAMSFCQQ